jgi:hypothetical protein
MFSGAFFVHNRMGPSIFQFECQDLSIVQGHEAKSRSRRKLRTQDHYISIHAGMLVVVIVALLIDTAIVITLTLVNPLVVSSISIICKQSRFGPGIMKPSCLSHYLAFSPSHSTSE